MLKRFVIRCEDIALFMAFLGFQVSGRGLLGADA